MAFWVPGKDFTIGVTREDIEEYLNESGAGRIPVTRGSQEQQSLVYFIRQKLGVKENQRVDIEVNYTDETTAKRFAQLGHGVAQERPDENNHVDLKGINLAGANFSNIKFNQVDVDGAVFKNTNFLGATFENMDFTNTNIQDASVDENILKRTVNIGGQEQAPTVTLTTAQRNAIDKITKEFKKFAYNISDPQKLADTIKHLNEGTIQQAFTIAKAFVGSIGRPDANLGIDEAFRITRLAKLTGKDTSTKNLLAIKDASAKYIVHLFDKEFDQDASSKTGWIAWAKSFASKDHETENLKQKTREAIIKAFSEGSYLQQEFLPIEDKSELLEFFKTNIGILANPDAPESAKSTLINQWKNAQVTLKNRWNILSEAALTSKTAARHMAKKTGSSALINLPKFISPYEKSSWPALDPLDQNYTAALARDIELKKKGAKFLAAAIGGGTGALATTMITRMFPGIPLIPTLTSSPSVFGLGTIMATTVGGIAGTTVGNLVGEHLITTENYEKFDSQFGDRLLELGILAETLMPNIKYLGLNTASGIALHHLPSFGPLSSLGKSYFGIGSSIGLYTLNNDFNATYAQIKAEKDKKPSERNRPGSAEFDKKLEPKLFNINRVLVAGTLALVGMTVLLSVAVIAGPVAGPVLAAIGALPDLALFGLWIAGAATAAATTYFGYGAAKRLSTYLGTMFKRHKASTGVENEVSASLERSQNQREKSAKIIGTKVKVTLKNRDHDKTILETLSEDKRNRLKEIRGNILSSTASKKEEQTKLAQKMARKAEELKQAGPSQEIYEKRIGCLDQSLQEAFNALSEENQHWVLKIPKENREKVLSLSDENLETLLDLPIKDRNELLWNVTKDLEEELGKLEEKKFQDAPDHEEAVPDEDGDIFHDTTEEQNDTHAKRLSRSQKDSNHRQRH